MRSSAAVSLSQIRISSTLLESEAAINRPFPLSSQSFSQDRAEICFQGPNSTSLGEYGETLIILVV